MDVDFKSQQYCGAAMSKIKTEQNIQQLKSPVSLEALDSLRNQRVYFDVQYKEIHGQLLQKRR